ncbi:hypothetical protein [Neptunicella sp. SCSIO 80796]|uniref:hypothetical protein n=1 Tax=Neptunicella plasticusilytica TaxID=3117012 RepID=UPI003A4E4E88
MAKAGLGLLNANHLVRRYLVPGLVFQSVIVGGGYGTGREIAEFFLIHGPLGGLLGMAVACIAWGLVLAVAFEFARLTKSYNYRTFFRQLLGRAWPLFEIIYLLIALLVLAVLGSAAAEMVSAALGIPGIIGTFVLLITVGSLAYFGSKAIEGVLAFWSLLLYLVYAIFLVWALNVFGDDISAALASEEIIGAWHLDGLRYAAYNLNALAAVLFVLPHLQTRQEAISSGLLAGVIGIVPGVFVFIAMLAQYPQIIEVPVPITSLLQGLNAVWFFIVFQIILFGTFIETGAGIIHAINERVASVFIERQQPFPNSLRFGLAVGILAIAVFLADSVGIIGLIAQGYGMLSYAFIAIVIVPLLTLGLYRIIRS